MKISSFGRGSLLVAIGLLASFLFATTTETSLATSDSSTSAAAPANQYFGRAQLSVLGIRNSLHAVLLQYKAHYLAKYDLFSKLLAVQDAVNDWFAHYPADPWIPQSYADLCRDFGLLQDLPDAASARGSCEATLVKRYPDWAETLRNGTGQAQDAAQPPASLSGAYWAGAGASGNADFGGLPYCSYNASVQITRVRLTIRQSAIDDASLAVTMVETASSCPLPPLGTRQLTFELETGEVDGDVVYVRFRPMAANMPQTTAILAGKISDATISGTLTLTRIDQGAPLAWTIQIIQTLKPEKVESTS